jgi:hypothetical protein
MAAESDVDAAGGSPAQEARSSAAIASNLFMQAL